MKIKALENLEFIVRSDSGEKAVINTNGIKCSKGISCLINLIEETTDGWKKVTVIDMCNADDMEKDVIPRYLKVRECARLDNLEFTQVVKVTLLKGDGTQHNPCRKVHQYWDMKGNFLFEVDSCNENELQKSYREKR